MAFPCFLPQDVCLFVLTWGSVLITEDGLGAPPLHLQVLKRKPLSTILCSPQRSEIEKIQPRAGLPSVSAPMTWTRKTLKLMKKGVFSLKNIHKQIVKKYQQNLRFDPKTRTQSKKIRSYEKQFQKKLWIRNLWNWWKSLNTREGL